MPCSSPSGERPAITNPRSSPESGSEITEDDFFSVKGGFSRSCSNASSCGDSYSTCPPLKEEGASPSPREEKKKLAQLFEDAYWINQVDNNTKLVDLLQDECCSKEFASVHLTDLATTTSTTPSTENTNLKSKQENTNHCCFPRKKEIQ
ncbi:hypothetical protein JCGZ_11310 [Jatropha curcas]|uniref:Uncharacterized protein n=2 Tax=Jatropha curcas TaxID=180498 RepID=A0A067KGG5_JATCU|nr:hypothetical protein JCGZ_11310 [Jatropha curcas]